MEKGAWQSTVHGIPRRGHNLVTKPPPLPFVIGIKKEKYPEVGYLYLFIYFILGKSDNFYFLKKL